MLILNRIKNLFSFVLKEHPFSFISLFIGGILYVFNDIEAGILNPRLYDRLDLSSGLLLCFAGGSLLCEAINANRKKSENYSLKKFYNIIGYALITLIATACFIPIWLIDKEYIFPPIAGNVCGNINILYKEYIYHVLLFVLFTYVLLTMYFFYKKSEETFEVYVAKAFYGLCKAALIYFIIIAAIYLVFWTFNALFLPYMHIFLYNNISIVLFSFIVFPYTIEGLSKTKDSIPKFAKIIFTYVLTTITAIVFFIFYIYLFKIIFTSSIRFNNVFKILAALFISSFFVWTLAQGCLDKHLEKPLKIFPFLFTPFIILQIYILINRISNYGLTVNRYLGLLLVFFEIIYFALYIYRIKSNKNILSSIIFVFITFSFISLVAPVVNMNSAVTISQSSKIKNLLELGDKAKPKDRLVAYNSYIGILDDGGLRGFYYLRSLTETEKYFVSSGYKYENYDETIEKE